MVSPDGWPAGAPFLDAFLELMISRSLVKPGEPGTTFDADPPLDRHLSVWRRAGRSAPSEAVAWRVP